MPPSVTLGSTVSRIPSAKPSTSEQHSRPSSNVDRPRSVRPAKIHPSNPLHSSDLATSQTLPSSWQQQPSRTQRHYPVLIRQQLHRNNMQPTPALNQPPALSTSVSQSHLSHPTSAPSQTHHHAIPASQQQSSRSMPQSHHPSIVASPTTAQQQQQQLSLQAQKQQRQPPRAQQLPHQHTAHPQSTPPPSQQQQQQQQQQSPSYIAARNTQHAIYLQQQQQHLPSQQMQQHLVQPHASQRPRHPTSSHLTSQQGIPDQQLTSHQTSNAQRQQKASLPQSNQRYVQMRQVNRGVQAQQQQQLHQQYQHARLQNPQAHLTQLPSADAPYPITTSKGEVVQSYSQQPGHHMIQKGQKSRVQDVRGIGVQHHHLPAQQVRQGQQQSSAQQVQVPQGSLAPNNLGQTPGMANGNVHGGQLYPAGISLPVNAISSAGMQYTTNYANTALFDQLNMNPSGLPLANVAMGQPVPSPGINVARDLERQAQHPQAQQIPGRSAVHLGERTGVTAQELQGYVGQGQQQMAHRAGIQGPSQQDLQDPVIPQHHMQQGFYQPLEQQQSAQHLVLNQNAGLVQQQHQGAVMMHNQTGSFPQHAQLTSPGDQLDHQVYQTATPNQLNGATTSGIQNIGDISSRKGGGASAQQELLPWTNTNSNARIVGNGLQQQTNGNMSNALGPGPLITQSQLLEMGTPHARQRTQNGVRQGPQQASAPASSEQRSVGQVRRLPQSGDDGSPRKRRNVNPAASSLLEPQRTFSCSGCGKDFARKRDRDTHVRKHHERAFSCSKCDSCFKTRSDANRHMRIVHDRVRPYPCPSCKSTFSERNKLRRHKETVHEKLRPYVCPVCSARFGELGNLRQHTGSLHPDYQVESGTDRSRVNHQVQS